MRHDYQMHIFPQKDRLPILRSRRLVLRDIQPEDVSDGYVAWLNDPAVTKYLEIRFRTWSRSDVLDYVLGRLSDLETCKHFGIYDSEGERLVGTVTIQDIRSYHGNGQLSFVIGHPDAQGKGYASEAVHAACYFCFHECRLYRLSAGYYAGHVASAKVLEKSGFVVEGREREALVRYDGVRVDRIAVGLLASEFSPREEFLGLLPPTGGAM